jgi:hypothetical protein
MQAKESKAFGLTIKIDCGQSHVLDDDVWQELKARRPELSEAIDKMSFGEIRESVILSIILWSRRNLLYIKGEYRVS